MNITVIGLGYVGLSNALLLSKNNDICAYDIDKTRIEMLKEGISPIQDNEIIESLNMDDTITFTSSKTKALNFGSLFIISTPTNYDEQTGFFDTSLVEQWIESIIEFRDSNPIIVIKSTVPVGFTDEMRKKYGYDKIIFSPEFLREGKALYDNLFPSRIVVGDKTEAGRTVARLLKEGAKRENVPILFTHSKEAEAIKLFSNTFLAMRISYFNELDTYAEMNNLSSEEIIQGMCLDSRIGDYYNNPSFGYGGYCLPKDTKQLLANYKGIPNTLMKAIVQSNTVRKKHIAQHIIDVAKNKKVGIYRLAMKANSDNFRYSAILDIINQIRDYCDVIIYEPSIEEPFYEEYAVNNNLDDFVSNVDFIIANRVDEELRRKKVQEKIYTRDIFNKD